MFERCDPDTRAILDAAVAESRRRAHNWLGTEHVLLALVRRPELLPAEAGALLPSADAVAAAMDTFFDQPSRPESELLKAVGVDLEQVRSAVRSTFGDTALEALGRRRVRQPWPPWRRPARRCTSILAGSLSVAPRLKRALEGARRHAERRKLVVIDPSSLLLGMVEVEDALSNCILRDLGVDIERLGRSLRLRFPADS